MSDQRWARYRDTFNLTDERTNNTSGENNADRRYTFINHKTFYQRKL